MKSVSRDDLFNEPFCLDAEILLAEILSGKDERDFLSDQTCLALLEEAGKVYAKIIQIETLMVRKKNPLKGGLILSGPYRGWFVRSFHFIGLMEQHFVIGRPYYEFNGVEQYWRELPVLDPALSITSIPSAAWSIALSTALNITEWHVGNESLLFQLP